MPTVHSFPPGNYWQIPFRWPVPYGLDPMHFEVKVSFSLSRAHAALEKTYIALAYATRGLGQLGDIDYFTLSYELSTAHGLLGLPQWKKLIFRIRSSAFTGKLGGDLLCHFQVLSQSTGPTFYVNEFHKRTLIGAATSTVRIE